MSRDDYVPLGYCTVEKATEKAVLLTAEDGEFEDLWVPRAVIEDGDDLREGLVEDISVKRWWKEKEAP